MAATEDSNKQRDFSPEPSLVLQRILEWLRGFHHEREKSKASDWIMIVVTILGMIAAFLNAWFLQVQISDARRGYRLDERAWIEIDQIKPTKSEDRVGNSVFKYSGYDIYLKNVGKSVARRVSIGIDSHTGSNTDLGDSGVTSRQRRLREFMHQVWPVMAPNVATPIPHSSLPFAQGQKKPGEILFFYVIGRIEYVDSFSVAHWKNFCFGADSEDPERVLYCDHGNDEDQNED